MRRKQRKRRLLSLLSSLSSSLPPISLSMIIIIILLYQQLLIGGINAMASNPYVSGIKLPGNQIEDQTFYGEIKSLIGGRVELPCNLTLPSSDDAIQLIFWHRGNNTRVPIYTVDGRASQTLSNATHFLSDIFQPNRAIFNLQSNPSKLIIDPVFETDHNDYRCRVDFRWGRTINSFVTLHVIVPPKKITIRDQNGNYIENSTIGPYDQNTDVILTCESNGGIPPPTLQWYKNGVMIDGSYIVSDNGLVSNELIIYKISTHDLYDKYVCQAGNYNSSSTIPIEAYVILDINLLPIDVQILTNRTKLLAGRKIDINCQTYGSKPAAIIKWFHNDKQLITPNTIESYESNKTFSSITFKPTVYDNGSLLKCRAYNPRIQLNKKFSTTTTTNTTITAENIDDENRNYIESIWRLEVLYSPQVILRIRKFNNNDDQHSMSSSSTSSTTTTTTTIIPSSISSSTTTMMVINEQTTLLIECFINANPSLVDVQILHNSTIIQLNKQLDVQEQNVTKILIESVNANHRGRYQCMAINQQGMSRSNAIQLNVQYVPFCNDPYLNPNKSGSGDNNGMRITTTLATATINQQNNHHHNHNQQYALAINESIRLKCDVQSNPIAINYYWTLNNVDDDNDNDNDNNNDDEWLDETKIIAQSRHEYDNELLYQIKTKNDYGKLSCWAENRIGIQRQPCSFRIQKAGPPSSLNDCSVTNKTTTSLTIECYPGDNGGSRQIFFANVYQYKQIDDDDDDIDNEDENENESLIDNKQSILKIKTAGNSGVNNLISIHHRKEMINKKINLTSETSPIFYLNNLQPGTKYHLELYAQNERGQSDFERLTVTTLFTKNTKLISSSLQEYEYESWYSMMFISILFTILLIVIIVYIVCRLRQRQISRKNRRKEEQIKQNFAYRPTETDISTDNVDNMMNQSLIKRNNNNNHQHSSLIINNNDSDNGNVRKKKADNNNGGGGGKTKQRTIRLLSSSRNQESTMIITNDNGNDLCGGSDNNANTFLSPTTNQPMTMMMMPTIMTTTTATTTTTNGKPDIIPFNDVTKKTMAISSSSSLSSQSTISTSTVPDSNNNNNNNNKLSLFVIKENLPSSIVSRIQQQQQQQQQQSIIGGTLNRRHHHQYQQQQQQNKQSSMTTGGLIHSNSPLLSNNQQHHYYNNNNGLSSNSSSSLLISATPMEQTTLINNNNNDDMDGQTTFQSADIHHNEHHHSTFQFDPQQQQQQQYFTTNNQNNSSPLHHQVAFFTPTSGCIIPNNQQHFPHQFSQIVHHHQQQQQHSLSTPSSSITDTPPPSIIQQQQQQPQQHHYFIDTLPEQTILYTTTSSQPQILSLNDKIDGFVLSTTTTTNNDNDYYGQTANIDTSTVNVGTNTVSLPDGTPSATAAGTTTIFLHRPGVNQNPMEITSSSSIDEEIHCDFNQLQQTAV